jgi:hypothetical protein
MPCTNKIDCPLFHEFDGHCCPEPMVCIYEDKPAAMPEHKPAQQMSSNGLAGLALVTAVFSMLFFYGVVRMERHYATQDMVNQEQIARR